MLNKDDAERLKKDVTKAYAVVACQRICGDKDPNFININKIEDNGTRAKKTIRLMQEAGYIGRTKIDKQNYISRKYYEILHFDEKSPAFANKGDFKVDWKDLYKNLFYNYWYQYRLKAINKNAFTHNGYIDIKSLPSATAIDFFWNSDDYDVIKNNHDVLVYPKIFLEQRRINTLRCLVERQFHNKFSRELEKRVGLPENSLETLCTIDINMRNPFFTPFDFNQQNFTGKYGFIDEIDYQIKHLQALRSRTLKFVDLAKKTGGFDKLIRQYRKDLIKSLFEDAALVAFKGETDSDGDIIGEDGYDGYDILGAQYILRNSDVFDYDTMFGSNEEVCHINQFSIENQSPHDPFEPSDQVKALIDSEDLPKSVKAGHTCSAVCGSTNVNEEKATCLAKMITERFQNI